MTAEHDKLTFDDTQHLLALALADGALQGIDSIEDLWQIRICEGDDELPLRFKDRIKALPILRNATMKDGMTTDPLSKSTFDRVLSSVFSLAGYLGSSTVHAIRRYLGKEVDGMFDQQDIRYRRTDRLLLQSTILPSNALSI